MTLGRRWLEEGVARVLGADVYRTASEPCRPACMDCMTNEHVTCDYVIGHWFCKVCGWCDCPPAPPDSDDDVLEQLRKVVPGNNEGDAT